MTFHSEVIRAQKRLSGRSFLDPTAGVSYKAGTLNGCNKHINFPRTMADKLRCAVIGAGGIGLDHLHSLATCHRAAAVAIAETNPQRAREASARHNIPRSYVDYREDDSAARW